MKTFQIFGYDGNDTITLDSCGKPGTEYIGYVAAGYGDDTLNFSECASLQVYDLSPTEYDPLKHDGNDTFNIKKDSKDSLYVGGEGNDTFNLSGDCGYTEIFGGYDEDTVTGNCDFGGNIFSGWSRTTPDPSSPLNVTVTGEWVGAMIFGSNVAEHINCRNTHSSVTHEGVTIFGMGGADWLEGGFDDDYIDGGAGADQLDGHEGNDTLYAVDGHIWDRVFGGPGFDVAHVDAPREMFQIDPLTGKWDVEDIHTYVV